jgi:hypothetical protein
VRCRAVLVSVDVLLKDAEIAGELSLRSIASNFSETLGKVLFDPLECGTRHFMSPCWFYAMISISVERHKSVSMASLRNLERAQFIERA